MDAVQKFTEKLKTDQDYRAKFQVLIESGDLDALNAFMKEDGFTDADIAALESQELWVHSLPVDGELSDAELESISGGGIWNVLCNGVKLLIDSF